MIRWLTFAFMVVVIAGCAGSPQPYSLQGIRAEAREEAFKSCISELFWQHRHVPTGLVWRSCESHVRRHWR